MKYFYYTLLFAGSLGTAGAVMNPDLVQKSAAFVGWELPQRTADSVERTSDEDQLSQFLAQYPFTQTPGTPESTLATSVPLVVVPEAAVPTPIAEPAAPSYASASDDPTQWNGDVAVPIYSAPVAEDFSSSPVVDSTEWSGPSQTYQAPSPAPQQSVYEVLPPSSAPAAPSSFDSPQAALPIVTDPFPLENPPVNPIPPDHALAGTDSIGGGAPTNFAPMTTPPPQPPPAAPPAQEMPVPAAAAAVETVPMYGTEMVARVGRQVILMGDILPKLRRAALLRVAENIKQQPEEIRAKITQEEIDQFITAFIENQYPGFLQEQIIATLVYNDYDVSNAKADKDFHFENIGKEFDRSQVSEMMKEFNVSNMVELKKFLSEKLGSSLERERRLWVQEMIVRQWVGSTVQRATGECTHDEMMEFYEANKEMFTTPSRARWQEMTVTLANYSSENEAREKMRWMGNKVAEGAPFEEIAKANSDGFTADKGGVWDWTIKGNLTSPELEQAIFTQPMGELSPAIIRSEKGLHIIRVLERQEVNVVPFVEAQVTIRDKIRTQRIQRYQEEYFADLRRRFPLVVLKDQIDFSVQNPRTANAVL